MLFLGQTLSKENRVKKLVLFLLLMSLPRILPAEKGPTTFNENNQALGGYVGELSGSGLHYQIWIDNLGIQISAGILYLPPGTEDFYTSFPPFYESYEEIDAATDQTYYTYYRSILNYSIGIEGLYSLYAEDLTSWLSGNLYLFLGLNHNGNTKYRYDKKWYTYEDPEEPNAGYWMEDVEKPIYSPYEPNFVLGIGIGMETVLFKHFSLPIEIGYAFFFRNLQLIPAKITLIIQGGLRYRF